MARQNKQTQYRFQLNLENDRVGVRIESAIFGAVEGLRERKKRATRLAIREAGMRLFAEQGFAATTMDQIAEAAEISRATVFTYFPTKEEIVFGDGGAAIAGLAERLSGEHDGTIAVVRQWLSELAGWFEPELVLQQRLVREVPVVGARQLQLYGEMERIIAQALQAELDHELAAVLAAASLVAALRVAQETAVARMEHEDRALSEDEIGALLADAVAFTDAGIAAIK
jgi:AcrR family transcriptional regulator